MPKKTLAELRSEARAGRRRVPGRSVPVCLAPDLVAEVQTLVRRIEDVQAAAPVAPRRLGSDASKAPLPPETAAEVDDLHEQLRVKLAEMADHEGEMRVEATIEVGDWRRWVEDNPPRGEDDPLRDFDFLVTAGHCNADALIDDLPRYAVAYDGQRLQDGDWDTLNIGLPDRKALATAVVQLYEGTATSLPNWRSDLSKTLTRSGSDRSPAHSGSRDVDSSAGSHSRSTRTSTPRGM